MLAWCHLKSPKVWLSNKVNVREAAVLEVGLLSANGNQSCFCVLQAVGGTVSDHWSLPVAAKTSALQIAPNRKKVLKSSFSTWFDMTSEVHTPPIPRFLYHMIWYLQLVNFTFKQNHVGLRRAVLDIVAYQAHMYMYILVICMGQETDNWTNKLVADLDRT